MGTFSQYVRIILVSGWIIGGISPLNGEIGIDFFQCLLYIKTLKEGIYSQFVCSIVKDVIIKLAISKLTILLAFSVPSVQIAFEEQSVIRYWAVL